MLIDIYLSHILCSTVNCISSILPLELESAWTMRWIWILSFRTKAIVNAAIPHWRWRCRDETRWDKQMMLDYKTKFSSKFDKGDHTIFQCERLMRWVYTIGYRIVYSVFSVHSVSPIWARLDTFNENSRRRSVMYFGSHHLVSFFLSSLFYRCCRALFIPRASRYTVIQSSNAPNTFIEQDDERLMHLNSIRNQRNRGKIGRMWNVEEHNGMD